MIKNIKGLTIIESLIGIVLLGIVLSSAMTIMKDLTVWQKKVELSLDFSTVRNQVINQINDYRGWDNIVSAGTNTPLLCYLNQSSNSISDRDCTGAGGPINIYDLSNQLVFDFKSANFGFSMTGASCTTYNGTAGSGDPNCPLKLNLNITPQCSVSSCVNPLLRVSGQFVYNGATNFSNLRLSNLDFTTYKSNIYCPSQTTPITHGAFLQSTMPSLSQVVSTQTGKSLSDGYAETSVRVHPCRGVKIVFSDDMATVVGGALTLADAENTANVCIYDPVASKCIFNFIRTYNAGSSSYTYALTYTPSVGPAVNAGQKPSWMTITGATVFEFQVVNGLVKFCTIDGASGEHCYNYFEGKLDFPFTVRFQPAGVDYSSSGLNNISITTYDL